VSAITQLQHQQAIVDCQYFLQKLTAYGCNPDWAAAANDPAGTFDTSSTEKTAVTAVYTALKAILDTWLT